MKVIQDRQEIAKVMNFGKYPVLDIDLNKKISVCGDRVDGYRGCKVRVPWEHQGKQYFETVELRYWKDENKLDFNNSGTCLHASFGVNDVLEMLEDANSPILNKNQEFVLVIHSLKGCFVILSKTDDYLNIHCQQVLQAQDCDIKNYIQTLEMCC